MWNYFFGIFYHVFTLTNEELISWTWIFDIPPQVQIHNFNIPNMFLDFHNLSTLKAFVKMITI
jgi:hypothetical protein